MSQWTRYGKEISFWRWRKWIIYFETSASDKQENRLHQKIKDQGHWNAVMIVNYCWTLMWDFPTAKHSRSLKKRRFKPWSFSNGDATFNLSFLIFINVHHSVYRNRCIHHVINIYCWTKKLLASVSNLREEYC